jgi:SAM-dependent methyltransferase
MDLEFLRNIFKNKKILDIGGPTAWLNELYKNEKVLFFNRKELMDVFFQFKDHNRMIQSTHEDDIVNGDITKEEDLIKLKNLDLDIALSSHLLEHIADPIKLIKNIWNILQKDALIITVTPNKERCWDKDRVTTSFDHIINDYVNETSEDDMTHAEEASCVINGFDGNGLKGWGANPNYYKQIEDNNKNRIIHHHVFDIETLIKVHEYANFKTLICETLREDSLHTIYIGKK